MFLISVYDTLSVFKTIKILDSFFEEYERKEETSDFSYKFDDGTFKQAKNVIFENDHSLCVAKLLWLYYNRAHTMNIIHVAETMQEIFKNKFFKLFFHWSWQVRNVFYYLLWFVINHKIKNKSFSNERTKLSKERLDKLNCKDEVGFLNIIKYDYPEDLKSKILKDYYEKMRTVELFRSKVKKEKLDPTFNSEFITENANLNNAIDEEYRKNIVM